METEQILAVVNGFTKAYYDLNGAQFAALLNLSLDHNGALDRNGLEMFQALEAAAHGLARFDKKNLVKLASYGQEGGE